MSENKDKSVPFSRSEFEMLIQEWTQDDVLDKAYGLSYNEIKDIFGNELIPILSIPLSNAIFKGLYKNAKNNNVYCGKAFFIDHAANHHPEMETEDYLYMPNVLSSPDKIFYDDKNKSVNFVKERKGKSDILAVHMDKNRLILTKTNFISRRLPSRWKEISLMDGLPIISHSNQEPGSARNISARNETHSILASISAIQEKSSDIANIKIKFDKTASNFEKSFKELVKEQGGSANPLGLASAMIAYMDNGEKKRLSQAFSDRGIKSQDGLAQLLSKWKDEALNPTRVIEQSYKQTTRRREVEIRGR